MFKLKVRIVIMSHLSDLQEMVLTNTAPAIQNDKINFVKWLLITFPDTNTEIDAEKEYAEYLNKYKRNIKNA